MFQVEQWGSGQLERGGLVCPAPRPQPEKALAMPEWRAGVGGAGGGRARLQPSALLGVPAGPLWFPGPLLHRTPPRWVAASLARPQHVASWR